MKSGQNILLDKIVAADSKALARAITMVENELEGYGDILLNLRYTHYVPVIGITGPPGAGKSTLVNCLVGHLLQHIEKNSKGIGVISVDPSSPVNQGAILGDRLRMREHFNDKRVFIRSLATRGALGGLSAKTIEVSDVMRSFGFDYILVETVGVGQSEVEIACLADVTLLVLTPESGDDIQVMKSGIMEIADIFVINKADRDGADEFAKYLNQTLPMRQGNSPLNLPAREENKRIKASIVKTIATQNEGIELLAGEITKHLKHKSHSEISALWAEKAYQLILKKKMSEIDKNELKKEIEKELKKEKEFNVYRFIKNY